MALSDSAVSELLDAFRAGVGFVGGVGLVVLETDREFVCVLEDLVNCAGHLHHLRNSSRAGMGHSTAKAALVYQHVAEGRDRIIADRMALLAHPLFRGSTATDDRSLLRRWTTARRRGDRAQSR